MGRSMLKTWPAITLACAAAFASPSLARVDLFGLVGEAGAPVGALAVLAAALVVANVARKRKKDRQ